MLNTKIVANVDATTLTDASRYQHGKFHNVHAFEQPGLLKTLEITKRYFTEPAVDKVPAKTIPLQPLSRQQLDALPDMLQALAPIAQRSDAHLYASESTLLRGDHLAIRPWLYVAVATVVIALGFSFGPEQLREWLPNLSDSTLKTEVSPAIEGSKAVNGMAPDQPATPNSANADNMAVLPAADPDPQAMQQDSAMEDLQQMEQGHEQMTQGDNGAPPASDSAALR